ncbi:hypothetical protein SNEBB_008432 [Seison nebaliae]|nr:hypothetical protein SNEBB_008432 [Seison nebaliae]
MTPSRDESVYYPYVRIVFDDNVLRMISERQKEQLQEIYEIFQSTFGINVEYISENDCWTVTSRGNFMFVMEPFGTKVYEHLKKLKCRIYGSKILIDFMKKDEPFPYTNFPLYSYVLKNCIICITNIDAEERNKLYEKIMILGGIVSRPLTEDVTHLIVGQVASQKYRSAVRLKNKPKLILKHMIDDIYRRSISNDVNLSEIQKKHKCPPLHGLVISISQFSLSTTNRLKELIVSLGGKFSGGLIRNQNTHLVTMATYGGKYEAAMSWKIPIITIEWLEECRLKDRFVEEDNFLISRQLKLGNRLIRTTFSSFDSDNSNSNLTNNFLSVDGNENTNESNVEMDHNISGMKKNDFNLLLKSNQNLSFQHISSTHLPQTQTTTIPKKKSEKNQSKNLVKDKLLANYLSNSQNNEENSREKMKETVKCLNSLLVSRRMLIISPKIFDSLTFTIDPKFENFQIDNGNNYDNILTLIRQKIENDDGLVEIFSKSDIVILPNVVDKSQAVTKEKRQDKFIFTIDWIVDCVRHRQLFHSFSNYKLKDPILSHDRNERWEESKLDKNYLFQLHFPIYLSYDRNGERCGNIFKNIVFCLSGMEYVKRCVVEQEIGDLKGIIQGSLIRNKKDENLLKTDYLICDDKTTVKFQAAIQWNIPVLSIIWIYHSIRDGQLANIDFYRINIDSNINRMKSY